MRRCAGLLVGICLLLACGAAAAAQTPAAPNPQVQVSDAPSPALSPDRDRELTEWLDAMDKWRRYDAKYYNKPARDSLGRITTRPAMPEPPEWLGGYCAEAALDGRLAIDARTATACLLYDDPRAPLQAASLGVQGARDSAETGPKYWSFLTRIHIDGLWSTAATTSRSYGLIGSHVSLVDVGRLQVFGPPGVLLLSVPRPDGSRRITIGYTWGISIRLMDVRLFGSKDMTLFANVSKVWIGREAPTDSMSGGYEIAGFSLAPRKKR